MHSKEFGEYHINFNSDFSGDILVSRHGKQIAKLPFMVMAKIVAEKLRRDRMEDLEEMDDAAILGIREKDYY